MQEPFVVNDVVSEAVADGAMASARASFNRAQASSADPKLDAAVDRDARATRYALALESKSEYAS